MVFGRPCDACMRKKDYWTCQHRKHERAPWKDSGKEARWSWMWTGDSETFAAEARGFVKNAQRKLIQLEWMQALRARSRTVCDVAPGLIWIALDFAEGGKDDIAVIAGYFTTDYKMVVSIERQA